MINLESYLLFIGASFMLCLVPGPDMIYMLSRSIAQGRRAGLMAAFGVNLGTYVHLFAAVIGLSAILATSSFAFTVVKWAGAAYLVYLGVQALRSRAGPLAIDPRVAASNSTGRRVFWQGFWSDVLNPKVAMFYLAFLPQFVDAEGGGHLAQLLLLGLTVNMIGLGMNLVIVLASSTLTGRLRDSARVSTWLNRAMGTIFIVLGLRLATEKV